jgi:hypothetical protein
LLKRLAGRNTPDFKRFMKGLEEKSLYFYIEIKYFDLNPACAYCDLFLKLRGFSLSMRKVKVAKHIAKRYPHHRPAFIKKVVGVKVKQIKASYHSLREWKKDPKGYFIIKVFYSKGYFGARFHDYQAVPKLDIIGIDAEAIMQTIVREKLVSSLQHAAYLGHELHKAEVALKLHLSFVQDTPLDFSKRTKKKESDNLPE